MNLTRYKRFDRSRLSIEPLANRDNDLSVESILDLKLAEEVPPGILDTAHAIRRARDVGAAVVLMMGAHVLRSGVQRYLIDLMRQGWISCLATNGAGAIHDFEFALIGETTESVARYIRDGRFGLWKETGRLNDLAAEAVARDSGYGETIGRAIEEGDFPHRDISIFAAAFRYRIPLTVHVGIGYDIVHEHPNCDGAAIGAASYTDFLIFSHVLERLENGAIMNFGSAVMAPEVYLKALSMVRNVARQQGREIRHFTTLVCDLQPLPDDFSTEPSKSSPAYYFRPWKTMLVRTVADGGRGIYVCGQHSCTIPQLWTALEGGGPPP